MIADTFKSDRSTNRMSDQSIYRMVTGRKSNGRKLQYCDLYHANAWIKFLRCNVIRIILISDIKIAECIEKSYVGNQLSNQKIRSGTSVSLNYGEAQDAESRKDFIHKMKVILKELRETMINLKLIKQTELISDISPFREALNENNELISIFVKSIKTAKMNGSNK